MKKTAPVETSNPAAPVGSVQPTLRRTFTMTNRNGLHARPCAVLIRTLRPFACEVKIECGEAIANGNSIFGVLSLAAGFGSKLTFTISDSKAAAAMAAVQQLFESQFQKAYSPENTIPHDWHLTPQSDKGQVKK